MSTVSPFTTRTPETKEFEDFELPPEGQHYAVLNAVIDLGSHDNDFKGKIETKPQIFLAWELPDEKKENGDSFVVGQSYTWSLHEKANFRAMLETWRGVRFKDNEEFDPLVLVGKACVISLAEGLSAKQKKFIEIINVTKLMKGQTAPRPTLTNFAWHMSFITCQADAIPIPDWCPRIYGKTALDVIKASKEWQALPKVSAAHLIDNPVGGNGAPVADDDIPF